MFIIDPDGISSMASLILSKINEVFGEAAVTLPTRQVLLVGGLGQSAHDDEQVTISWEQTYSGEPGQQAQVAVRRTTPRSGVFVVELVRSIPDLYTSNGTPLAAEMTATANIQMQDAALLYEAGMRACEGSMLGRGIVDLSAGAPSGGLQAVIMTVILSI